MSPTSMPSGNLSSWKLTGKSWFFGIGINTYKEFPNLINAVRDVKVISDLLVQHYDIDEACVINVYDEDATEENILNKLDYLAAHVEKEDKLIFYYSGHGLVNNNLNKGYWIPHDAKKNSSARYILNSTIQDYVGGIQAKHILVVSDACFSGSMFMRGSERSIDFADELEEHSSRWGLCSGRRDEEVYDGEPGAHSPFAQSFLNLLTNTDRDFIPIGHLVNYVVEQTASNYQQLPEGRPLFGVGHEGGQYVFRKKILDQKQSVDAGSTTMDGPATLASASSNNNTMSDEAGLKMIKWIGLIVLGAFVIVGGIIVSVMLLSNDDSTLGNQGIEVNGKIYPTLKIGNQEWMASNMNNTVNDTSLFFLNNTDPLTTNQLGQLYSYQDAIAICNSISGGEWRLAVAEDFDELAAFYKYPVESSKSLGYTLPREFASSLAPGGRTGLSLRLGGNYFIDSKEFSPTSWDKLNAGRYWLRGQRILKLTKYGAEYTLDITAPVASNHACSCRCIKKQ